MNTLIDNSSDEEIVDRECDVERVKLQPKDAEAREREMGKCCYLS